MIVIGEPRVGVRQPPLRTKAIGIMEIGVVAVGGEMRHVHNRLGNVSYLHGNGLAQLAFPATGCPQITAPPGGVTRGNPNAAGGYMRSPS